jgi:hypothetical protein
MYNSIAILISGAIRNQVPIEQIFEVIDNIKEQFSFFKEVHIYFTTWESPNNNNEIMTWKCGAGEDKKKPVYHITYDDNFINKLKNKVDFLYIEKRPDYDSPNLLTNFEDNKQVSQNIFRLFYGVNILCNNLQKKYDFICRCRNDLIIKGDFKNCVDNIINNISEYETSFAYWVHTDCINDQFCITTHDNFLKVWNNDNNEISRMFKEWNVTAEKLTLMKIQSNKIKYNLFLPSYYLFRKTLWVENSEIIFNNLYGYMKHYMVNNLSPKYNLKINFS